MAKKSRKFGSEKAEINITSLLDMFTIILAFLLKSFSAEGYILTQADNLRLPYSSSMKTPSEVMLSVSVDQENITIDNKAVAKTAKVREQDSLIVESMVAKLKDSRIHDEKVAMILGQDMANSNKIIVQIDKNIPYDVMYKVMATCGFAGYNNISFAVVQKNPE